MYFTFHGNGNWESKLLNNVSNKIKFEPLQIYWEIGEGKDGTSSSKLLRRSHDNTLVIPADCHGLPVMLLALRSCSVAVMPRDIQFT